MKIVDVAELYSERGGGIKTYIHEKLARGSKLGHDILILAPGPEDREHERYGGRIRYIKSPRFPFDPNYYLFCRTSVYHEILNREQPDLVEASSAWLGGLAVASWRGAAARAFVFHQDPVAVYPQTLLGNLLGTERVDRLFSWYWGYLRWLGSKYDATIVSGNWLAEKLRKWRIKRPEAVPFGIDKSLFSPARRCAEVKRRLLELCGSPPGSKLFVCVSRHHPEKRLHTVIQGFSRVASEEPSGLVIFGDGFIRKRVQKWADRGRNVHLAGFLADRDELATALASADYYLHGGAAETYGLSVAEAICSGLPLVVPDQGGAHDLGEPGYAETYRAGDSLACAAAIARLLRRDREQLVASVSAAARSKVGTVEDHFNHLFELYARLAAQAGASS